MSRQIAVLLTGGIDSLACAVEAIKVHGSDNVDCIYYHFGQRAAETEINNASTLARLLNLPFFVYVLDGMKEDPKNGYVPFRNIQLILSTAQMGYTGVYFGMLRGESPPDKNPVFVSRMTKLINSQLEPSIYGPGAKFEIYCPFRNKTKTQVVQWLCQRGFTRALSATVGCLHGNNCGACTSCLNRWTSFKILGLEELLPPFPGASPGEWAMNQLAALLSKKGKDVSEQSATSLLYIWKKRHHLIELYRALDKYCDEIYSIGPLSIIRSRMKR